MSFLNSARNLLARLSSTLLHQKSWFRRIVKTVWILFFLFIAGLPLYVYMVKVNAFNLFGEMPRVAAMQNPENDLSSELLTADGASLGMYFRFNRSQVTYDQLPPKLVKTLLISEDHRFYEHSGLDLWSFVRVIKGVL